MRSYLKHSGIKWVELNLGLTSPTLRIWATSDQWEKDQRVGRADEGGAMTETTDKKLCDHCYAGLHGDCAADCTCECNAPETADGEWTKQPRSRGVEW